ncbi:copper chaperone PCu(A)C [Comamonas nitrativorans]|uniref:Copper chaperone PCu(A)C n=1 Tax=Comamonas nitrativorans TaxID=108437 RepID=A0ABV9GU14_9BURK
MTTLRPLFAAATLLAASFTAWAEAPVQIDAPWARATVAGQQASGAFMRLTAHEPLQLVGVTTPVAAVAEVHEMKMDGDMMKMRAIPSLALPAGQTVELQPGGYHLMFMQLKAPLEAGSTIPVTLQFKNAQGQTLEQPLQVPVKPLAQPAGGHAMPQHGAPMQHKAGGMQH